MTQGNNRAVNNKDKTILQHSNADIDTQHKLEKLVELGIAISKQKDNHILLKQILFGGQKLANADAATLYTRTEDKQLRFAIRSMDDTLPTFTIPLYDKKTGKPCHQNISTHVALTGETVRISDIYNEEHGFDISGTRIFDESTGYRTISMLTVPLSPRKGEVIGVLQLINAKDPKTGEIIPFTKEMASFCEALSSQAAIAMENQQLIIAQKELMDSIVQVIASAIDAKSAYTGGHCERVPLLVEQLAKAAHDSCEAPFAEFKMVGDDAWRELLLAAWLHDCGKVTTPEHIVDKATKLETINNRIHEIRMRFEVLRRDAEIEYLKGVVAGDSSNSSQDKLKKRWQWLDEAFTFVSKCNIGGEYMSSEDIARLQEIAKESWVRNFDDQLGLSEMEKERLKDNPRVPLPAVEQLLADKPEHLFKWPEGFRQYVEQGNEKYFNMVIPEYMSNLGDLHNLSISKGTLTPEDRFRINDHVIQTILMLKQLPVTKGLSNLVEYAGGHHEAVNGTGYPKGLNGKEMSLPARILAVADIFEALTASDRPYKKAKKLSEAVTIMSFMQKDGHIDPDLFKLFLKSGIYLDYANTYLRDDQIDEVDIDDLLN
ncbi:MAG: GAF domain-containing protein [Magnetococcales bacterium]|nr:GAF domain-containing protein [Magnetococcales bacterium]